MLAFLKIFQASLSLPGSPFNLRRGSRGSHQFTIRNGRGRFVGPPGGDRKPLVLSTYLDAQVRYLFAVWKANMYEFFEFGEIYKYLYYSLILYVTLHCNKLHK